MDVVKDLLDAKREGGNTGSYHQEKPGEPVKLLSVSQVCSRLSTFEKKLSIGSGEWNFLRLQERV